MVFYDPIWQDFPDTGSIPGAYGVFYQGVPIDHCKHVQVTVDQCSSESECNVACTAGMALAHFRMLNNELLKKDPYVVPEQTPLVILDIKSAIFM